MSLRYDIFSYISGTIYTFDNAYISGTKPSIRQNQTDFSIRIINITYAYRSPEPSAWDFTSATVSIKQPDGTITDVSSPTFQLIRTAPYGSTAKPAGSITIPGTKLPHEIVGTYTCLFVFYKSGTAIASGAIKYTVTDTTSITEKISEHIIYFDQSRQPLHIHCSQNDSSSKLSFKIYDPDPRAYYPSLNSNYVYLQGKRPDNSELFLKGVATKATYAASSGLDSRWLVEFSDISQVTEVAGTYIAEIAFYTLSTHIRQLTSQRIIFHIEPKP